MVGELTGLREGHGFISQLKLECQVLPSSLYVFALMFQVFGFLVVLVCLQTIETLSLWIGVLRNLCSGGSSASVMSEGV